MSATGLFRCLFGSILLAMLGSPPLQAQGGASSPADSMAPRVVSPWGTQTDLGPLSARLTVIEGGTLQRGQSVRAEVELCNRGEAPLHGRVSILSTTAWQARPGREFPFSLDSLAACFTQGFELALLDDASPGPYDLVLRVEAQGNEVGTLRTRFMRPMEWLVIGPFPAQPATERLPPENGIRLEGSEPGLEGPVRWQRAPLWAYDAMGALEMDLLLGAPTTRRCACTFTVFDLSEGETLHWKAPGAQRLLLDGRALERSRPVRVTPGRHTLLARVCGDAANWKLSLTLLRDDGTWPRNLENNLERFLPGFGDTWGREDTVPAMRHVVLQVRAVEAREVFVLGPFNSWVPWKLERESRDTWKRELFLPPGRHAYKLRIDGVLTSDPGAERSEADGFGGTNSLLIVR